MSLWTALAVYMLGWVLACRPALRRRMLAEDCIDCRLSKSCPADYGRAHGPKKPRGAISDRDGWDVAAAVWAAMWWPLWLLAFLLWRTLRLLGAGVKSAIFAATPLTQPELERRVAEQQAEIARLSKQIGVQ
jgi:hypothetical protein